MKVNRVFQSFFKERAFGTTTQATEGLTFREILEEECSQLMQLVSRAQLNSAPIPTYQKYKTSASDHLYFEE